MPTKEEVKRIYRAAKYIDKGLNGHREAQLKDFWKRLDGFDKALTEAKEFLAKRKFAKSGELAGDELDRWWADNITMYKTARAIGDAHSWFNGERLAHVKAKPLDSDGIAQQLLAVEDQFDEFKIDFNRKVISCLTPSITLEDEECDEYELGQFRMEYFWEHPRNLPRVLHKDGNTKYEQSYPHPHIDSGGELCTGDAGRGLRNSLDCGHLLSMFDRIVILLSNYNPDSEFTPLRGWFGPQCSDCGEGQVDLNQCRCGSMLCERCISKRCASCGQISCCTENCENNLTLGGCSHEGCEHEGCGSCMIECCICDNGSMYCSEHTTRCPACSRRVCSDHQSTCQYERISTETACGRTCCDNCIKTCEDCNTILCEAHVRACSSCNRTLCPKCQVIRDGARYCGNCAPEGGDDNGTEETYGVIQDETFRSAIAEAWGIVSA